MSESDKKAKAEIRTIMTSTVYKPNGETEKMEYMTSYPIRKTEGLLRVTQKFNAGKINITLHSALIGEVIVRAVITDKKAMKDCDWKKDWKEDHKYYFPSSPFYSDSHWHIGDADKWEETDGMIRFLRKDTFHGENRLTIDIREPGDYVITVPLDMDVEMNLGNADVLYKSKRYTWLDVECSKVNFWGECGSSTPGRQSWTYYSFGDQTSPVTSINTKGAVKLFGNINSRNDLHLIDWSDCLA